MPKVTFKVPDSPYWHIGEYQRYKTFQERGGLRWNWWRRLRLRDLPFFVVDRVRAWKAFGGPLRVYIPLSLREQMPKRPKVNDVRRSSE